MGKQANSWIGFVKKTWGKMKRTQKNVSYKDAMKKAKHEWKQIKKIGGAATSTGVASNAATVSNNAAASQFGGAFDAHDDHKRKRMGGTRKNRKGSRKNRKGTHKKR